MIDMTAAGNMGKVLVVDDMKVNVKILSVKLRASGYEVFSAYNGEDAVRIARAELPDVILLDVMMPGMDGYEVTETLKADPDTDYIPVVLVTALKGIDDKVRGFDAGADDFISKPPNQTELLARVRSLVKLKKLQEEARLWAAKKEGSPLHVPPGKDESADKDRDKSKGMVLIVEDDPKTSELWQKALDADCICAVARSGEEAFGLLEGAIPDIVLLDLDLSDMDGLDFLKRLKKNPNSEEVSIVAISNGATVETRVRALDLGADDFLEKPVNGLELVARVKSAIRRSKSRRRLKAKLDEAFRHSITDPLTGLFNRQYFNCHIEKALAIAKRHERTFSLIFIDIDYFKSVNDKYGHLTGDAVIVAMAELFTANTRASDVIARYGGEEFVVVLSDTKLEHAAIAAEKLRLAVESKTFSGMNGNKVTASLGVAEFTDEDDDVVDIIKRADDALYRAKEGGRNRVELGTHGAPDLEADAEVS